MCGPARSVATSIFMIVSYNNPVTVYKSDPFPWRRSHTVFCNPGNGIYVSSVIVNVSILLLYHASLIGNSRLYDGQCPTGQFTCNFYNYRLGVLGQMFSVIGLHDWFGAYGLP